MRELGPGFAERAAGYDRETAFPFENYAELRDAGMLGLCIPERYGGMGASFQDYMHVSAELARFCPMTALTYNMHSQTTLWTGILADDLDMAPDVRERHERIRSGLYRWILEDGAIMSQPLSEGIARGATAGVATTATPVPGGFHVNGRKVFASLAGAADAYNFTCRVPGEEGLRFLSVRSDNPGVRIVGDWDPLGMRGTDSRTLVFEDAFVEADDELLPTGGFDQLAARWPHVYLTLTPTYIGLTRAVVDFVQGYLGSTPPPGIPARRDVPAKQWAWAEIQIAYERSRSLWECAVAEAGLDPDARAAAPRLGGVVHGDGDRARGRRAGDPRLRRRLADAQPAARAALPRRALRLGHAALERRGVPRAARPLRPLRRARRSPPCLSARRATWTPLPWPGARPARGRSCCSSAASA